MSLLPHRQRQFVAVVRDFLPPSTSGRPAAELARQAGR